MEVIIDKSSGYCFGVEYAIEMAEETMKNSQILYCLGDIVHNAMEVKRLKKKGLQIIDKEALKNLKNVPVLIRAHGEPPETYKIALENNIQLIDASCPVVLKLQNRVKNSFDQNPQIVIYGKKGHAEVIGLSGQTNNEAIIITEEEDLNLLDFSKPITLYSQTTKSTKGFYFMKDKIEERIKLANPSLSEDELPFFNANDSICRQVSNREPQLIKFSEIHDTIIFVSGKKSSNGKALYAVCKRTNPNSFFIENEEELNHDWFKNSNSVGICGATSTPMWLMEHVQKYIQESIAVASN